MGKCCVSGCGEIAMDEENKQFTLAGKTFHEGDCISIDGSTGNIYDGIIPTVDAVIAGEFGRIMMWADKFRKLKVRTNADTPRDAKKARELGAEGIGLCRTEHMFFSQSRISAFREMICADTVEERRIALAKILPYQQDDFEQLFEALDGQPVTIRFLDPPLHEFVPHTEDEIAMLAKETHKPISRIKDIIDSLHETNPMMGHRGCRLCVTYPEIAVMQTKAVIRAAINVQKRHKGWNVRPEIMIPLTGDLKEFKFVKDIVVHVANEEIQAAEIKLNYEVGTMIEVPRAALVAGEIAEEAEFFCFGTNDLTQMTFGFSRDDAGKFLGSYYDQKIFENDPFARLDQSGVGKLIADTQLVIDALCADERVDAESIGIAGHSLGGKMAFYTGCLDERVRAILASDFGIGWHQTNWQADWYFGKDVEGLIADGFDHAGLLSVGGKPFCLIAGLYDTDESYEIMCRAEGYAKDDGRLRFINHATGHRPPLWALEAGYEFLDMWLKQ